MGNKRLVLCLDGTWNNPYQRAQRGDGSHVLRPSNPLKMARAVLPCDPDGTPQITYYDTGVGSLGEYPGLSNRIVRFVDRTFGGAFGAGFEANIDQAATFLVDNYVPGDQVFVFGFSRGAAQARGLTRFLDWMGGIPGKDDAYFIPLLFREYLRTGGQGAVADVQTAKGQRPEMLPISVDLLGVWDTVMALGSRFRASNGTTSEVSRSFHVAAEPAGCVRRARQALAIDERRYDFRPEIWRGAAGEQSLEQRWFPGVHSNVGGGYIKDGLANLSLGWFLREARDLGLALDEDYVGHFRGYHGARQYKSSKLMYTVLEFIRLRRGKGVRSLVGYPAGANLALDPSVIRRLHADPAKHEQLDGRRYRPKNVLEFLQGLGDLPGYLREIGLDDDKGRPEELAAMLK